MGCLLTIEILTNTTLLHDMSLAMACLLRPLNTQILSLLRSERSHLWQTPDARSALFPPGFRALNKYIYPYLSDLSEIKQRHFDFPKGYKEKYTLSPAGGGEGGNPSLYETFVVVTVNITNTGTRTGQEVVQLYVSFPNDVKDEDVTFSDYIEFPVRVLRGFDKVELAPGETTKVELALTRKDLSYWSTRRQNWVMPVTGEFTIALGNSSRTMILEGRY